MSVNISNSSNLDRISVDLIQSYYKIFYKVFYNIENVLLQILFWTQVLISFDRFIFVFFPIKGVRIMVKKWVLYSIMLGLFAFTLCVNSPYFIRYSSIHSYNNTNRTIIGQLSVDVKRVTNYIKILLEVYIPYLIMITLDFLVIVRLRKSKTNILSSSRNNRTDRFTINTILIDLIYLIFNLSASIFNIYFFIRDYTSFIVYKVVFINHIFQLLPFIYSCFIFFIFIAFNRIFRTEFFSVCLVLKRKVKNFIIRQH